MIYIFCDEAISSDSSYWVYLYSAVAFSQRRYNNSGFSRIERLRKGGTSLLEPINEMLKATEGFALLSQAHRLEFPKAYYRLIWIFKLVIFQTCHQKTSSGL